MAKNDNFRDLDFMDKCEEKCVDDLIKCFSECENVECETKCRRTFGDCNDACPCMPNCYDGCQDCPNAVCTCKVSISSILNSI